MTMENQNENQGWNARQAIAGVIEEKLAASGVELNEDAKNAVIDYLINNRMIKLDTVKDLGTFTHYQTERVPYHTLLINHLLVYIHQHTVSVRQHEDAYQSYLEDNELYEDEYSYEEYLQDHDLTDEEQGTQTYYHVETARVGDVFFGFVKEQKYLEQRVEFVSEKLQTIKEIVGENFLPGLQ